jgi:hypothetical protein
MQNEFATMGKAQALRAQRASKPTCCKDASNSDHAKDNTIRKNTQGSTRQMIHASKLNPCT